MVVTALPCNYRPNTAPKAVQSTELHISGNICDSSSTNENMVSEGESTTPPKQCKLHAAPTASKEGGEGGGSASTSASANKFEWENNKENMKPLRRGRKVDDIHAGYGGGLGGDPGVGGSSSSRVLAELRRYVDGCWTG